MILHLIYIYIKSLLGPISGNIDLTLFFTESCTMLIILEVKALLVRIMATVKFLCLNSLSSFTHLLNISLDIRGSINRATLGRLLRITHHCMLGWCLYFHVDRNCSIGSGEIIDAASFSIAHNSSILFLKRADSVKSYFPLCFLLVIL